MAYRPVWSPQSVVRSRTTAFYRAQVKALVNVVTERMEAFMSGVGGVSSPVVVGLKGKSPDHKSNGMENRHLGDNLE